MVSRSEALVGGSRLAAKLDISWLPAGALMVWTLGSALFPALVPELPPAQYWWMAAAGTAGVLASIALREAAQAAAARRLGVPRSDVRLFVFAELSAVPAKPATVGREALVAMAGALVSLTLCAFLLLLLFQGVDRETALALAGVLFFLGGLNAALAIANLLPLNPLGGWRIAYAALLRWTGRRNALLAILGTGGLTGLALAAAGLWLLWTGSIHSGIWALLIGLIFLQTNAAAYRTRPLPSNQSKA
jgi:Zn-dependent protease